LCFRLSCAHCVRLCSRRESACRLGTTREKPNRLGHFSTFCVPAPGLLWSWDQHVTRRMRDDRSCSVLQEGAPGDLMVGARPSF
jgi:hypothetical protein